MTQRVGRGGVDPAVFDRESAYWLAKRGVPDGLLPAIAPYLDRGLSLLDVGCGGGRLASALAPRFARVTGIDSAAGLLEEASRRWPTVRFVAGDCLDEAAWERLGGPFDLIVSNCSIRRDYTPDLPRLAALAWDHLTAGGGIALRIQGRGDLAGIVTDETLDGVLYDRVDLEAAFSGSGWDHLSVTRESYRQRFSSRAYLLAFLERIGLTGGQVARPRSGPVMAMRVAWLVSGRRSEHGGPSRPSVP
jgi:SAM-dependent methyltransferase